MGFGYKDIVKNIAENKFSIILGMFVASVGVNIIMMNNHVKEDIKPVVEVKPITIKEEPKKDVKLEDRQIIIQNSTIKNVEVVKEKKVYVSHPLVDEISFEDIKSMFERGLVKPDRTTRREVDPSAYESKKIKVWTWKGGARIRTDQLESTIRQVLNKMPIYSPNNKNFVKLLIETACVESDKGFLIKQKRGPALGIYQIEPNTYKYTMDYLKKNASDIYDVCKFFYNEKEDETFNRCMNVPYQTAVATAYYWICYGNNIDKMITNKFARSMVYKYKWNTYLGAAKITDYYKRVKDCI